ncbi:MAG: hypothetical protein PHG34_05100 [Candidatus Cloacimonetes bacterium]|jgi:hypothetical protein|nr:hypothetical protein [Candidatus Cloacimonadota bacterium]MDY0324597.1 hypothetical protein [Candidatus Cloacimonadaceae bacterium]
MKSLSLLTLLAVILLCVGCAQNIPMKNSINEYVLMNIKTSSQKGINYSFSTNLTGTKLPLYGRNKTRKSDNYICDENAAFSSMLKEYVENKFLEISETSPISLNIKLVDFYVEYYPTDNAGTQALNILANLESNHLSSAKLSLVATLAIDGQETHKRITASADVISSGEQDEVVIGDSINQANNKALMLINAFLAENGM